MRLRRDSHQYAPFAVTFEKETTLRLRDSKCFNIPSNQLTKVDSNHGGG